MTFKPSKSQLLFAVGVVLVAAAPALGLSDYGLHLVITALLWSFIYTCWSLMGRAGLVSFGHGAFIGIGAYGVVLAWNLLGLSPWISGPVSIVVAVGLAAAVSWPCFRFGIVGHYFAIVTLALAEIVRLVIIGLRDWTGGQLGLTPNPPAADSALLWNLQISSKLFWFYVVLVVWLAGLVIWRIIDRSMSRIALEAIAEDEQAAASIGIGVTGAKLRITMLSAALTCLGGVLFALYLRYVNPETTAGLSVSLNIVFGVVVGGMSVMLGPTMGAFLLLGMAEALRLALGNELHSVDRLIYGALLVLFIMYMPRGILGETLHRVGTRKTRTTDPYSRRHRGNPAVAPTARSLE